jgi:hypothetical protein
MSDGNLKRNYEILINCRISEVEIGGEIKRESSWKRGN